MDFLAFRSLQCDKRLTIHRCPCGLLNDRHGNHCVRPICRRVPFMRGGHAAAACAAFPGWNTLRLGAHRACLRPGGDVTFEFGGHLAECLEIRAKVSRLLLSVARRAISSQWDVAEAPGHLAS
jgi:hypothetical protein